MTKTSYNKMFKTPFVAAAATLLSECSLNQNVIVPHVAAESSVRLCNLNEVVTEADCDFVGGCGPDVEGGQSVESTGTQWGTGLAIRQEIVGRKTIELHLTTAHRRASP